MSRPSPLNRLLRVTAMAAYVLVLAGVSFIGLGLNSSHRLASAATAFTGFHRAARNQAPVMNTRRWRLAFDDEFRGRSIDLGKWSDNWFGAHPESITHSDNRHDLNCIAPDELSETHGALVLSATPLRCRVPGGNVEPYAGGLVTTRTTFTFTYGFIEARLYVPAQPDGSPVDFPAFWATGVGPSPRSGEIDVMEVLGGCGPGVGYHFHGADRSAGGCEPLATPSGWHTFAADWEPGRVSFYCDGVLVGQATRGVTASPMYLVLNNSVDPTYGGSSVRSRMLVDYVRVWQPRTR